MRVKLIKAGMMNSSYEVDGYIVEANFKGELTYIEKGLEKSIKDIRQALFDFWGIF